MRRAGLFCFFALLWSMLFSFVIDPDDDGSGDDSWLDEELDGGGAKDTPPAKADDKDEKDDKNLPPKKEPEIKKPETNKELEERLAKIEEREAAARQREDLLALESELKAKYPNFEMKKAVDYLKELNKKEPGSGDALFTRKGIEILWKSEFVNSDGVFDDTRGSGVGLSEDELSKRVASGQASLEEERKLFGRFA